MQRRFRLFVEDMLNAAETLVELAGELSGEELASDIARKDRILWNFTVLGEASRNIPDAIKATYPGINWRKAADFRNRIVHGYTSVHWKIVHHTIHKQLPPMIAELKLMLEDPALPDDFLDIDLV